MVSETKMLLVANVKIFSLSLQLFNPQLDMMTVIKQNTVKNCTQRTEGGRRRTIFSLIHVGIHHHRQHQQYLHISWSTLPITNIMIYDAMHQMQKLQLLGEILNFPKTVFVLFKFLNESGKPMPVKMKCHRVLVKILVDTSSCRLGEILFEKRDNIQEDTSSGK